MQLKFSTLQMLFLVACERGRDSEREREKTGDKVFIFMQDCNMVVWLFL